MAPPRRATRARGWRRTCALAAMCVAAASAAGTYYDVPNPNVRQGCTARCTSTAAEGTWKCDQASTGEQVCSTFELAKESHDCHFHAYTRRESAECFAQSKTDLLVVGGSYMSGFMAGIFPWYDPTAINSYEFDAVAWLNVFTNSDGTLDTLVGAEIGIDPTGSVVRNTAFADNGVAATAAAMTQMLGSAPARSSSDWYSRLTFFRARSTLEIHQILDKLKDAGRHNDNTAMLINVGMWTWYCFSFGNCNWPGSDFVASHRNDLAAVMFDFQESLVELADRIKSEFPNYKMYWLDYSNFFDNGSGDVIREINGIIKQVGGTYGKFINLSQMLDAPNATPLVLGHTVHVHNQWIYQRLLSQECFDYYVNTDPSQLECEEEVVMSKGCMVSNPSEFHVWYDGYLRSCDFQSYKRLSDGGVINPDPNGNDPAPSPSPAPPSPSPSPSPSNPTPVPIPPTDPVGDEDDDGGSSSNIWEYEYQNLDPTALVLNPQVPAQFKVQGKSSSSSDSDNMTPWDYDPAHAALFAISGVIVCATIGHYYWLGRKNAGATTTGKSVPVVSSDVDPEKATSEAKYDRDAAVEGQNVEIENEAEAEAEADVDAMENGGPAARTGTGVAATAAAVVAAATSAVAGAGSKVRGGKHSVSAWGHLDALDGARYLASLHIVAGHLVSKNPRPVPGDYVLGWGFTWVPWFMMLSGYVLTYSSLKRAAKFGGDLEAVREPATTFLYKRVMSIYPLYLIGLIAAACVSFAQDTWENYTDWLQIVTSLTLTQAWIPKVTETVLQSHCWFLSCIIPYWFLHGHLQRFMASLSRSKLLLTMAAMLFIGWLVVIIPAMMGVKENWYNEHSWESIETWEDIAVVMIKFHPAFYLHIYVFGIGLACLLKEFKDNPPLIMRYGAVLGYVGLVLIFTIEAIQPVAYKLSCRQGALAPLQGLVLLGLSFGVDPISKLLSCSFFKFLGEYSYSQYILQFVAYNIWDSYADLGFIVFLFAMAVVGKKLADLLGAKDKVAFERNMKAVFAVLLAFLLFWAILPMETVRDWFDDSNGSHKTPAYVQYTATAYDVRLNLSASDPFDGMKRGYAFINPSILHVNNDVLVAARRHKIERHTTREPSLQNKKITRTIWHSDIVIGELDPSTLSMLPNQPLHKLNVLPAAGASGWTPCAQEPIYHPHNDSYTQVVVTGPQDPRILVRNGLVYLTFFSTLPNLSSQYCPTTGTIGMLYMTDPITSFSTTRTVIAKPLKVTNGQVFEKNWGAFTVGNSGSQTTYFMQHLSPFTVLKYQNGLVTSGGDPMQTNLEYLSHSLRVDVHGGSNALPVSRLFEEPYFLSSFHTLDASRNYVNYLMKTTTSAPYQPIALSSAFPVVKASDSCTTFSSGLTVSGGDVFVAYGSCDSEARVLRLSFLDLRYLFDNTKDSYADDENILEGVAPRRYLPKD